MPPRTALAVSVVLAGLGACVHSAPESRAKDVRGAWRLVETASRAPGTEWERLSAAQGGLYVFAGRHYSYFYVRGTEPRARFADGNRPTDAERAAAFQSFIAGAGTYTFDGRTLALATEFRKNPNEMGSGAVWRWRLDRVAGDTVVFVFAEPPFLPGREWRTTMVRVE